MAKDKKEPELSDFLSGTLNLLGLKIDLKELLASPEAATGRLGELRERLKAAGGKEVSSDAEWRQGGVSVAGHFRTHGLLGEQEYHVGTTGRPRGVAAERPATETPEVVEPPVDVFYEGDQIVIVADVPGVSLDNLDLKVKGKTLSFSSKETAPRKYRKELLLEVEVEPKSLRATCHNGALEIRLRKRAAKK